MTTNLEQIAKQVSLLNSLVELLRLQEDNLYARPAFMRLKNLFVGTTSHRTGPIFYVPYKEEERGDFNAHSRDEAWNHPITQKAWGDELVRVAKELYLSSSDAVMEVILCNIADNISSEFKQKDYISRDSVTALEAILNKYGRSLSE